MGGGDLAVFGRSLMRLTTNGATSRAGMQLVKRPDCAQLSPMTSRPPSRWPLVAGVAIMTLACSQSVRAPASNSTTRRIVAFSDLHFNPFSDSTLVDSLANVDVGRWRAIFGRSAQKRFSPYGKDTNYPLFASALSAMQRAEPNAALVLFAGDFMSHHFQDEYRKYARDTSAAALAQFTAKTNRFLALELATAFPGAQVLPALGNNDSGCGDYMSQPGSAFLRSFAEAFEPLVNRNGSSPAFVENFARAGHYSAFAPAAGARVIVLNDVYWSPRYANACGSSSATPGRDALAWLERELNESRSRGEQVWLLAHIPVGVDAYATSQADSVVNVMDPAYSSALISLIGRFRTTVRYGIYGHTHMNEFRVITDSGGQPRLGNLGTPSVSPLFANNPAFFVLSVDSPSGALTDYATYSLTNLSTAGATVPAAWSREYDFTETYGSGGLSAPSLSRVFGLLATDSTMRAKYIHFYDSGSGTSNIASKWRPYWCGIENIAPAAFSRCFGR